MADTKTGSVLLYVRAKGGEPLPELKASTIVKRGGRADPQETTAREHATVRCQSRDGGRHPSALRVGCRLLRECPACDLLVG